MMPGQAVTTTPLRSSWLYEPRNANTPLIDTERGGAGYQSPAGGMAFQLWTLEYKSGEMHLTSENGAARVLFSRPGVTEVSLAFDLNMNPVVGFTDSGGTTFWYFDTLSGSMAFAPYLPAGSRSLRATLDDRRSQATDSADVVLAYIRSNNLYMRQQRDRYETEYLLAENAGSAILNMGMSTGNRLQFRLRK